jgi:hypothetical protein
MINDFIKDTKRRILNFGVGNWENLNKTPKGDIIIDFSILKLGNLNFKISQ